MTIENYFARPAAANQLKPKLKKASGRRLPRAKEPLYHIIVSFAEGERPTYEQARAALDTQIRHLGFAGLQYVAALQNDGVGGMYHVHAVFNRVDPVTHVACKCGKTARKCARRAERPNTSRAGGSSK